MKAKLKKWKKKIIIKRKKQQQHKNNNKQITIKRSYIQTRDPPTKIFSLLKKTLSRYQTGISLHSLKFTTTPKHNMILLKSDIHKYTQKLRLTIFSQST